jgi:hypothetical protein
MTRSSIEPSTVDEYLQTFAGREGVLGALRRGGGVARLDGVRAEGAAGVKERTLGAFWTRVARSLLASGEREAESV